MFSKIKRIARYVYPYKYQALLNVVCNIFGVLFGLLAITMAQPFLGILFDRQKLVYETVPFDFTISSVTHNFSYFLSQIVLSNGPEKALLTVCIIIVVLFFLKTGFTYLADYFISPLRNGVVRDIRNDLYRKILKLPLSYFSNEKKGDLISRITGDVQEIDYNIIQPIKTYLKEPVTILFYLSALIYMSPRLTIFVFVLLPIAGLIIGRIGKSLRKKSVVGQRQLGLIISLVEETLGGLRIIKAFNAEKRSNARFTRENDLFASIQVKLLRRRDLASPMGEFLGTVVMMIVMWYGGSYVLSQGASLSPEGLITYMGTFFMIINPAKSFSSAWYNLQKGLASWERVEAVLDAPERIVEAENAVAIQDFKEGIEFKDVSFKYNEQDVLKNINLVIPKGKTIALVGQSGSGKSTMVDLIPRFYDIYKGDLLVDGVSIKQLKIRDLRRLIGYVNQESILFNDTIHSNIAFGVESASLEEVESAARVANAHQFIMETPEGYQTNIGDRGSKLSGGQRQRLSIARAVLKNPPLLILDEATSALDTESERLVQDALVKLMKNRTSIVIAHRLSTVVHADLICVLHEGEIVERGKHEELIKLNGVYKRLHDLQMFA